MEGEPSLRQPRRVWDEAAWEWGPSELAAHCHCTGRSVRKLGLPELTNQRSDPVIFKTGFFFPSHVNQGFEESSVFLMMLCAQRGRFCA